MWEIGARDVGRSRREGRKVPAISILDKEVTALLSKYTAISLLDGQKPARR